MREVGGGREAAASRLDRAREGHLDDRVIGQSRQGEVVRRIACVQIYVYLIATSRELNLGTLNTTQPTKRHYCGIFQVPNTDLYIYT